MIRAAALVAGDGSKLQAILDSMYFNEIPDFELVSVISSDKEAYAMTRAQNAGVPSFVVDPELFPNMTSYTMSVASKLRDMDVDLVILAGYELPLGVIPYQFKNGIIGTCPSLIPAFEDTPGDIVRATLERGVKVTGATAYVADPDGRIGGIILQKAVEVKPEDGAESLRQRILEEAEWGLLCEAVKLYCSGKLEFRGNKIIVKNAHP